MVTAKVDHGLCMTCNNGPTCHYRAVRGPAVFCEMFDNYASPIDAGSCGEPSGCGEPPTALCATEEKDDTYAGLCLNCRHRATCAHPRPTGGIWHCEDYD